MSIENPKDVAFESYAVTSDAHNWILTKTKLVKQAQSDERKAVKTNLGYFATIPELFKFASNHALKVAGLARLDVAECQINQLYENLLKMEFTNG